MIRFIGLGEKVKKKTTESQLENFYGSNGGLPLSL